MVGLVSSAWSKCSYQEPLAARILWLSQGHRKIGSFHAVQCIDHLDATFIPSSVVVVCPGSSEQMGKNHQTTWRLE